MHKQTTVYEVEGYDGADPETYYFGSLVKAQTKCAEMRANEYESISLVAKTINLDADGIARAMQHLVDRFCINEH